jgi:hypothetical protein
VAEGLTTQVPPDAALVIVAAPVNPFLAPEVDTLRRYLDGGGRLLVFLEPDHGQGAGASARKPPPGSVPFTQLLSDYGIDYVPVVQDNDRLYGRRSFTEADHEVLVSIGYETHPSVQGPRANAGQYPLILMGSGAFEVGKAPPGLAVNATIRAMPGTWGDLNGNFRFDPPAEKKGTPVLAVAVDRVQKPGQKGPAPAGPTILAFADADLAANLLLQNRANRLVMEAGVAWVAGQAPPPELPTSEEDVRIQHAKGDDWLWFYLPVVGVPLLVLLIGAIVATRRRRVGGSLA